jgi:hypothetical protein
MSKGDVDNRAMTGEWYTFDGTLSSNEFTVTAVADAFSTDITGIATAQTVDFALTTPTNVNRTGYTGLRLHVSGGQPTGFNYVEFATLEHATNPAPQLIVDYTVIATAPGGQQTLLGVG